MSFAESRGVTAADLEKDISDDVRRSIKVQFILDQLAEQEELGVEQDDIGQYVTQLAYQQGVAPDVLARQLTSAGQLGAVVGEVLRSKAATLIAERAQVTDQAGRKVDIKPAAGDDEADPDVADGDTGDVGEVSDEAADDAADDAAAQTDAPSVKGRAARRGAAKAAAAKGDEKSAKGRSKRGAAKDPVAAESD
jgi:trigger factor